MSETTFDEQIEIDASTEAVWAVLGDYGPVSHYVDGVVDSRIVDGPDRGLGATRHCDLPGKPGRNYIVERIVEWDEGSSFRYEVTDTNAPITNAELRWSVTPAGPRTKLRAEVRYSTKFGLLGRAMNVIVLRRKLRRSITQSLADIKTHIEARATV